MRLVNYLQKGLKLEINTSLDFDQEKGKEKKWGFDLICCKNSLNYVLVFDEEIISFPGFYAS